MKIKYATNLKHQLKRIISITLMLTLIITSMFYGTTSAGTSSYDMGTDWLSLYEVDSMAELEAGIAQAIHGQDTVLDFELSAEFTDTISETDLEASFEKVQTEIVSDFEEYNVYSSGVSYDALDNTGVFSIVYYNSEANLEQVQLVIDGFVSGLDSGLTQAEKARAVYDFILSEYTYGYSSVLLERNLLNGLNDGVVVCQAYALMASKMLSAVGLSSVLILGDAGGAHIWNMVSIDGQWYHFDTTWGDTSPGQEDKFFLTSNDILDVTHNWIIGNYPIATSVYVAPIVEPVTAPVITVAPYETNPTNQDIVVSVTTDKGVLNTSTHTFTENGSFDFISTDGANVTTKTVTISNIDKTAPVITVGAYSTETTDQDIVVTASVNDGSLNATSHTFTENGSFEFVATDEAGNTSAQTVTISNIDKVPPVITIGGYTTVATNQDVTVTATTNEGTLNLVSKTFSANGSFDFIATDEAGNTTTQTVTISNIDKVPPVITIGDYTTEVTDQDITVSATTNKGTLNLVSKTFTANGSFDFIATDEAGNTTTQTVTINNIDKSPVQPGVAPVITIASYNTDLTNQDVTVIATTDKGTLNVASFTFTQNGTFTFTANDGSLVTNETITVTNIDKIAPVISIGNYTTEATNQDIVVTASVNDGSLNAISHTFTENGSFEFTATDTAGNISSVTITISNIDKSAPEEPAYTLPVITVAPYTTSPTNQDLTVYVSVDKGVLNATSHTFTENGTFEFVVTEDGYTVTTIVTISNIDKVAPVITVAPYTTTTVNTDIIVMATTNKGTLNATKYTFTANGSFVFIATDSAGNVTTQMISISNINKVVTEPTPTPVTPVTTPTQIPTPTPVPVLPPTRVTQVTRVPLTEEQITVKVEEVKTESVKTVENLQTSFAKMTSMTLTRNITNSVMMVNNQPVKVDVKPFIVDKTTKTVLVPVRFVTEGFGFEIQWLKGAGASKAGRVVLQKEGTKLVFDLNSNIAYVNGKAVKLDTLPTSVNGRTYLSIESIIQLLDIQVQIEKTNKGYELKFNEINVEGAE